LHTVQPEKRIALIDHLEKFLGPIAAGCNRTPEGTPMPFQVVRFDAPPFRRCTAFTTLGLSNHLLSSGASGKLVRFELFLIMRDADRLPFIVSQLHQVGMELLQDHRALLRGQVIGPRGPLWPDSKLEALYCAIPVYLPREFGSCTLENGEGCAIAWLVPITREESVYVHTHGWEALETALSAQDPDLLDAYRGAIHVCAAPA
jgi:hypothetical protein